ncbi:type II toxin-antitoxin system HipA family toxin [Marinospirillum sp.]|uniref:type II toxin-antitoxin system HipA family toxin n=1 Tax=Marinospirillum sp. TaxID=2183934 RepID=UPI00384A5D6C
MDLGLLTKGSVHHYQPTQVGQPVSLTMTRPTLDGYSSGALHPIFSQNLPEGFNRRFISERLARYARVDDMYLLALQGEKGVGMLAYDPGFELPEAGSASLNEILNYQGQEPLFPQLLEKYYLRNTLSGVQPKVSILDTSRTLEQKDLIVKAFDEEFPLLTVNEFVCMQAARHCGLEPPPVYLSENLEIFVVERFDKPEGRLLGYEDFTTLMKRPNSPDAKYTGSYETLLEATYLYTQSFEEVRKMYRYIVFNCLIGNGDAHLKNFALQYAPDMQKVFVSPPFDITHTPIYDTLDNKMALKLKGSKVFPEKKFLVGLAASKSFRIREAEAIVDSLAEGILDYLKYSDAVRVFEGLKASITQSVSQVMVTSNTSKPYRHDKKRKFD